MNKQSLGMGMACLSALGIVGILLAATQDRPGAFGTKGAVKLAATGWTITPAGTSHERTGDMLLSATLRPDGALLATASGGASAHNIYLVDANTGKIAQTVPVVRVNSGLAWSPDGNTLYVCGGNSGLVQVLSKQPIGTYALQTPIRVKTGASFLDGLALNPDGKTLYVADMASNTVFSLNTDGTPKTQVALGAETRPGALKVTADGRYVLCALWGKAQVLVLDAQTLETKQTLKTGRHPNDMAMTTDGRLFVSCGNDDVISVFDFANLATSVSVRTEEAPLLETIRTRLTPGAPAGSTPSGLTLSPDEKTLYVACSDNNAVAVVNISRRGASTVSGMIPTAHYPVTVASSQDGKRLFVCSGKGTGTGPNSIDSAKPDPEYARGFPYITTLLAGVVSTVNVPDTKELADYTKQVLSNSPYKDSVLVSPNRAPKPGTNPIPSRQGDKSPIEHVLYIIKENRTYDQILGDLEKGNGDKKLCLFGEDVTPNHHALAREFVTLDNLYCTGEVSVDGHHWSNGAYVPDIVQRTWHPQYGGKGTPPFKGADSGDALSANPNGRIWDLCADAKLPFRTYYYHTDKNASEEWAQIRSSGERDYKAVDVYLKDVAQWEKDGQMPRFMVMALSEDHTRGASPGAFTPKAAVASNDLGIGKIVEALSKSRYWAKTAIFIIEDDAQNGPDHVDAHRTVGLVISPYTHAGKVDSTFYTTCSFLRTQELILGLPPMSQFDAAATPLYTSFANKPNLAPYVCKPAKIDLNAKNPSNTALAKASLKFDFSEPDQLTLAQEQDLNRILWQSVKGANVPYPGINHHATFNAFGQPLHQGITIGKGDAGETETETEKD
jgi:DNA-binding beta-propeller fold protein YncE